jgi:hypothetical protein
MPLSVFGFADFFSIEEKPGKNAAKTSHKIIYSIFTGFIKKRVK